MEPESWKRSEELFHAALDRQGAERTAFIEESCGDDAELRRDVLSLLASYEATDLDTAVPSIAFVPEQPAISGRIGAYRIEREIGHGGMGAVYLASRADDQYRKQVAIKVVRAGLATPFFAERLRGERQILAELEHPNIARLLDGGVTPDGQPFLVMEYVDGLPIDEYCVKHALPIRERLHLFRRICGAVQYAHQRLVVHRDLKPANILVTSDGEPKLLDFGIAKLVERDKAPGETTELLVGTPLYASPELHGGDRATTASDVYSLGVILYCLLTGRSPYGNKAGVELLHSIVAGEIVRPSAVAPNELRKALRGDLDHIVLRALERQPGARYASAELLSEDVRRHLESLPILAGGDSFFYGASKFVRRNRITVAAAGAVAASLLAATGTSLYHSGVAARERSLAQERLASLRKLTGTILFELHDSIQNLPGATQARKLLVQRALEYLNSLDAAVAGDPSQWAQLTEAYRKIGDVQGNPTNANLGDTAGALASYAKALEFGELLLQRNPNDFSARAAMALLLQRKADTVAQTGNVQEAVDVSRKSLAIFSALAEDVKSVDARQKAGTSHIKLGDLLGHPSFPNLGDRISALDHYRQALSIYQALPPDDAVTRRYLGIIHERMGKMFELSGQRAEALESYNKSFSIREALANDNPTNTNARRDLAIAHEKIGDLLLSNRQVALALPRFEEALKIFESLRRLDPFNANASRSVAVEYEKLATVMAGNGHPDRAKEYYAQALPIYQQRARTDPMNANARADVDRVTKELAQVK